MALPRSLTRATGAVLLAASLALSAGSATVLAADPPTTTDPGAAAAGWLAAQVEAGVGPGSLADAIFAYAATGVGADAAADALAKLEAGVEGYILSGTRPAARATSQRRCSRSRSPAATSTRSVATTSRRTCGACSSRPPGPDLGRFGTAPELRPGVRDHRAVPHERRCARPSRSTGSWPPSAPTATSSGTGRAPAPAPRIPTRPPSPSRPCSPAAPRGAAATSTDLLLDIQGSDGSFSSFGTPNTNSTGVAGQALRAAGKSGAANDAGAWVLTLQYGCDAPAADRGAFPWATSSAGFLVFSTPQAVLALGAPSLADLSIAGASAAAPILECDVAEPSDRPVE